MQCKQGKPQQRTEQQCIATQCKAVKADDAVGNDFDNCFNGGNFDDASGVVVDYVDPTENNDNNNDSTNSNGKSSSFAFDSIDNNDTSNNNNNNNKIDTSDDFFVDSSRRRTPPNRRRDNNNTIFKEPDFKLS